MSFETDTFGQTRMQSFHERFRFQNGPDHGELSMLDIEDENGVTYRARLASCIPGDPLSDYKGHPEVQLAIIEEEIAAKNETVSAESSTVQLIAHEAVAQTVDVADAA